MTRTRKDLPTSQGGGPARDLRAAYGMTREAFARLVGCSVRTLADWETGRRMPGPALVRRHHELKRLVETLGLYVAPADVARWLATPNDALGKSPTAAIEEGELDRVWRLLFLLESGSPS